mmetsp:Transcript_119448/g.381049  ORF Transcript_119448/g.381049 Transcript_119448/m.381049 type:complete len:543 (-) Transcript_119448:416-2044(-)
MQLWMILCSSGTDDSPQLGALWQPPQQPKRAELQHHSGEDCWVPCGERAGFCKWCGQGIACCRSFWQPSPPECHGSTHLVSDHFECVVPAGATTVASSAAAENPKPASASAKLVATIGEARAAAASVVAAALPALAPTPSTTLPSDANVTTSMASPSLAAVDGSSTSAPASVEAATHPSLAPPQLPPTVLTLAPSLVVPATGNSGDVDNSKWDVAVGIFLLNLGKVDLLSGQFDVDFYVYFSKPCDAEGPYTLQQGEVEKYFPNGVKGISGYRVRGRLPEHGSNATTQYRVKGSFHFPVDTRDYPFEQHTLEIMFEDPERTVGSLGFVVDELYTGINEDLKLPGFSRDDIQIRAAVVRHIYPPLTVSAMTFSRYKFQLTLKRPVQGVMIKLLPPVFLVLVVSFNSLMPVQHVTNRISVSTTNLMAAVMYHSNMASQAPSTGQFTKADQLMVTIYMLITLNLATCMCILTLDIAGRKPAAQELHENARMLQWALAPLSLSVIVLPWYVVCCLILALVPCLVLGRRRLSKHLRSSGDEKKEPES